jgi:hypothetical protein
MFHLKLSVVVLTFSKWKFFKVFFLSLYKLLMKNNLQLKCKMSQVSEFFQFFSMFQILFFALLCCLMVALIFYIIFFFCTTSMCQVPKLCRMRKRSVLYIRQRQTRNAEGQGSWMKFDRIYHLIVHCYNAFVRQTEV